MHDDVTSCPSSLAVPRAVKKLTHVLINLGLGVEVQIRFKSELAVVELKSSSVDAGTQQWVEAEIILWRLQRWCLPVYSGKPTLKVSVDVFE